MAQDPIKLSTYPTDYEISEASLFVGLFDNGDGTFRNVNYTPGTLIDLILDQTRRVIVASITGTTITNAWIEGKDILTITTDNQIYLRDEFFTQDGASIHGINGVSFTTGQKLLLSL